MFPSLLKKECGIWIRNLILESNLTLENIDSTEMLLYVSLNRETVEDIGVLENFLPTRVRESPNEIGMSNCHVKGPKHQSEIETSKLFWKHKDIPLSTQTKKLLIAKVLEIGINAFFSNFVYTFNGEYYL